MSNDERRRDLLNLWTHQSTLLWSRVKVLSTIEVAALAAWYHLSHRGELFLSYLTLIAASVLLILLLGIMYRDVRYMSLIEEENLFPRPKDTVFLPRGRTLARMIAGVLIAVNIVLLCTTMSGYFEPPPAIG